MQKEFQIIIDKIKKADKTKTPFVIYKLPDANMVKVLFQRDNEIYYQDSSNRSGFVFSPFDNQLKTIIFPEDKCESISAKIESVRIDTDVIHHLKANNHRQINKKKHIELIKKGILFLHHMGTSKVVLSRKEEIELSEINALNYFLKLVKKYDDAFVYLWYHPKIGKWLGASPETFLTVKGNKFKTMALAGTQEYKNKLIVNWGEKEIDEQKFVVDFISEALRDFKVKAGKPFTKKAGNVLHICTDIEGELRSRDQIDFIIKKLHPTPAVCGIPKEEAKKFIIENEGYDRQFYTGYLGEFNIENNTSLFVNLRCLQVKNNCAFIYIGGGITRNSKPLSEWEETVVKSRTMISILEN